MTTTLTPIEATLIREDLSGLVSWAAKSLPSKPDNPLLAGLRITATEDVVNVTAFDGDTCVTGFHGFDHCPDFDVIVPGKMFATTLEKLAGLTVTLTLTDRTLTLKSGRATAKFPILPHDAYPQLPTPAPDVLAIEADTLAHALDGVHAFADDNPLSGKPDLASILMQHIPGTGLQLAATNSYVMARVIVALDCPHELLNGAHVLVPPAPLLDAVRGMSGTLQLGWSDGGVFTIASETRSVTTRTVVGEPKHFGRFFAATDHPTVAYVDTAELVAIVRRASAFLVDKAPLIIAVDSEGEITVAGSGVADAAYEDAMEAHVTGESYTFGIRPAYLLTALASVDSALVRIAPNVGVRKMIRFDPAGAAGDPVSDVRSSIVMPVSDVRSSIVMPVVQK